MQAKRVISRFWIPGAGALVAALAFSFAASAEERRPTDKASEQLKQAVNLSAAFQHVAERLRPSLVSISSVKRIQLSQRNGDGSIFGFSFQFPRRDHSDGRSLEDFFQDRDTDQQLELQGQGTGLIVDGEGYILTNSHVVLGADEVKVKLFDGRTFKAKTVGTDSPTEVGVLKIEASKLSAAELGDSDKVGVGEWVLAMGSPFGLDQTVTAGIISAKGRSNLGIAGYEDFLQTDAAINPGNSGGPLVNLNGQVIGINTAIASRSGGSMGIGFAIPINMARTVMDKILKEGRVQRGWLGIAIQEMDDNLAQSSGFQDGGGVLISDVSPDGPAGKSGLRAGDILTKFDGKPVQSRNQFRNHVAASAPGTRVALEFFREGQRVTKNVELAELPTQDLAADSSTPSKSAKSDSTAEFGLRVRPLTPEIARQLGHDQPDGVVVIGVDPKGLAAKAGVQAKDIVIAVGNQPIRTVEEFRAALRQQDIHRGVRLQLRTGGLLRFVLLKAE